MLCKITFQSDDVAAEFAGYVLCLVYGKTLPKTLSVTKILIVLLIYKEVAVSVTG